MSLKCLTLEGEKQEVKLHGKKGNGFGSTENTQDLESSWHKMLLNQFL